MVASIPIGSREKRMKRGQSRVYLHESKMNHRVKRIPSRCNMICTSVKLAKMGGTLVPISINMNSTRHSAIMV